MAITAAQVSATRKSRATQAASSIPTTAMAASVTARVRESRGSAGFSTCRSPLVSLLSMISDWGGGRRKRDGSRKATSRASRHVDDHQLRPVFPRHRASRPRNLARIGLTTIMAPRGRSEASCPSGLLRDRTMRALTELIDLNRILLNLARSREFPYGSPRHGYDFIAPLDAEGHIDPLLWKKYRDYCRVRRFWEGEEDEVGRLLHKPGGAEHSRWVFDYNSAQ